MITDEDVERIAVRVAEILKQTPDTMTMEEAAVYLGIRAASENLSSTFTKLSNPKYNKFPLKCYYIGRKRQYKKVDLDEFMDKRARFS